MKCEKRILCYLQSEKKTIPFTLRLHMIVCSECRNGIMSVHAEMMHAKRHAPFTAGNNLANLVMSRVYSGSRQQMFEKNVSVSKWLFAGTAIIAGILFTPYLDSLIWVKGHFGSNFEIPLNLMFGIVITIYSAVFIASHLEGTAARKMADYFEKTIIRWRG